MSTDWKRAVETILVMFMIIAVPSLIGSIFMTPADPFMYVAQWLTGVFIILLAVMIVGISCAVTEV